MFALFFVGKVTSVRVRCSVGCFFSILSADPLHLCSFVCHYFNLRPLICMCEMCCSGVKCSAVPSSTETSTHPPPRFHDGGGRMGLRRKNKMKRGNERGWTWSPVLISFLSRREKIFCVFVRPHSQEYRLPSLSLFGPLFRFLSFLSSAPLSFPCLSVTDSGKRVLALTPRAPPFVMKGNITALICAYFASF